MHDHTPCSTAAAAAAGLMQQNLSNHVSSNKQHMMAQHPTNYQPST
jgi:hypothetical protein